MYAQSVVGLKGHMCNYHVNGECGSNAENNIFPRDPQRKNQDEDDEDDEDVSTFTLSICCEHQTSN